MIPDTPCSCGGNNENCFRCGGLGLYGRGASQKDSKVFPVAKDALHNSRDAVTVRSGWDRRRLFAVNSPAIGKKSNAVDRPSPADHTPQGVLQSFPKDVRELHKKAQKPLRELQNPNRVSDSKKTRKAPQNRSLIVCGICNQLFLTNSLLSLHHKERHMCSVKVQLDRKTAEAARIARANAARRKDPLSSASKITCGICGKKLKSETGVVAHRAAVHTSESLKFKISQGQKLGAKLISESPLGSNYATGVRPTYHQIPSSVSIVNESKLDGSRDYYENYREGGRLGSHSSHDAYGDEDFA